MTTYRADWVFTGRGEPIRNGVLRIDRSVIVEIKEWSNDQIDVDLGQSHLIPGLVNAHTHLDLGALRGRLAPPSAFNDWLLQVIDYRRKANDTEWTAAIEAGLQESRRHGTIWLGDISCNGKSLESFQRQQMDGLVFLELIGMKEERVDLAMSLAANWMQDDINGKGLSPHAPYSVSEMLMNELHTVFHAVPMAMHLAETREELQLIQERTGPFREFLQQLGVWQPELLYDSIDDAINLLNDFDRAFLIHGNYLEREQWQRLAPAMTVVYCPRTHAYFGHVQHPYLNMLADGVSVALGTDSLASNPDLSILNECRFLWQRDRGQLTGPMLMNLATNQGATALALGKPAHFVVVPAIGDELPWEQLWGGTSVPTAVYLAGNNLNIS